MLSVLREFVKGSGTVWPASAPGHSGVKADSKAATSLVRD